MLPDLASNQFPDKFKRFAMDIGDDLSALVKFNTRRADKVMLEIGQLAFDAQFSNSLLCLVPAYN